jgi:putative peptide zinc metalloprotease protein
MTATAEPPAAPVEAPPTTEAPTHLPLDRGEGVELLGDIHGCGYRNGACLVRRRDGQMVQLGPLMYALLETVDGRRDGPALAEALSEKLGRRVKPEHVRALAQKLAAQGLLSGHEEKAPPRRNPLLALRWKVLVTNPKLTRRLTAPFTFLFRPWVMWPILAAFVAVFWFVLIHKGVAGATAEVFRKPGLFLIVFGLAIVSAGLHELGHAAAARYGGATPGGMGMGLYLVWPAFYTDVTDAYRLPKRDRLRVDLAGLYFNAAVAVITMGVWLLTRIDALLLLVALQVLQMVKQLSPVIRADGYHILSDATGVPDLFAHMIPTMRRLLPGHRHEPSALSGRARALVTAWVLIVVPVLLSLMLGAVVLLPHLATNAWNSGSHIVSSIGRDASHGQILDLLAGVVSLLALILPVVGCALVTQKIVRTTVSKGRDWSRGRPGRRGLVLVAGAAAIALMIWAWWPSGQYKPIPARGGTLGGLVQLVASPASMARPVAQVPVAPVRVTPGTHLALAMIPVGGATKQHPALFVIRGQKGKPPVAIYSTSTPAPPTTIGPVTQTQDSGSTTSTSSGSTSAPTSSPSATSDATAFPFKLPAPPGPGGTQALATNTTNGGVKYDVAYSLVTVKNGAPVTNTNSAYALAHCQACTTVAVSFQVVLVIGQSNNIAPINAAGALNYDCPACTTTAIADQIVITLKSQPSQALLAQLEQTLKQLNALPALGAGGTPAAVASEVATVQQEVETAINQSGLVANPPKSSSTSSSQTSGSGSSTSGGASTTSTSSSNSATNSTGSSPSSSSSTSTSSSGGSSTTSTTPASGTGSTTTTTTTTTSTAPTTTGAATTSQSTTP